jgi:hypothetical protein
MPDQVMTFEELVAPYDRHRFLNEIYRQKPIHIPGEAGRFDEVFSWDALNELLAQPTLWSSDSFELAGGGRGLPPEEFCVTAPNREGRMVQRPDMDKVRAWFQKGASATINFIDLLTPGLRSMTRTLESVLGAQTTVSAFLSWHKTQGYPLHFDVQDVFAVQISGTKNWRVYQGRFPNPADIPGGHNRDLGMDEKKRMAGQVQEVVQMTPGDLLYIPAGQFHEALSTSEASLHVSFGVCHLVAWDLLNVLVRDLGQVPDFRAPLPDPADRQGHAAFAQHLGKVLQNLLAQPDTVGQIQAIQRDKAFSRMADFNLPDRQDPKRFRVLWRVAQLKRRGEGWRLSVGDTGHDLNAEEGRIAEWVLKRDYITLDMLDGETAPETVRPVLDKLGKAGVLAPL